MKYQLVSSRQRISNAQFVADVAHVAIASTPRSGVCRQALSTIYGTAPELLAPLESAFGVKIPERLRNDGAWAKLAR